MLCGTAKEGRSYVHVAYSVESASSDNSIIDDIEQKSVTTQSDNVIVSKSKSDHGKKQKKKKRFRRIWTKYLVFDLQPQEDEQPANIVYKDRTHYTKYSSNGLSGYWSLWQLRGPPSTVA